MCSTMYARDRTHAVLISTLPPSSLSALFCGKKKTCTSAYLMLFILGRLVHECARRSPNSSVPITVVLSARTVLIRCVSCCMTSQASGDVRVRGAVWKAHVQQSESHYTVTDCYGELKAGHKWRQWSEHMINAKMLLYGVPVDDRTA